MTMRDLTSRNTLRSQEAVWRKAPNAVPVASCPLIAGALATLGANFADSAEPICEHPIFLAVGAIAALGLFAMRVGGAL
jgi:hypothetical protein